MELLQQILILAACVYVIWKACNSFQTASLYLGRNMPAGTRGATINAALSSFPELVVSSIAIFKYAADGGAVFGVYNIVGSLLYNITIIPLAVIVGCMLAGNIKKLKFPRRLIVRDSAWSVFIFVMLMIMMAKGKVTFTDSVLLVMTYVFYVVWILNYPKKVACDVKVPAKFSVNKGRKTLLRSVFDLDLYRLMFWRHKENTTGKAMVICSLSVGIFYIACEALVDASYAIGAILDIPSFLVAMTITAAATSIPDTAISVKDAQIGKFEDSISNAIATNIFNAAFCVGFPFMLYQLVHWGDISVRVNGLPAWQAAPVILIAVLPLVFFMGKSNWKTKIGLLLAMYIGFVAWTIHGLPVVGV